MPASVEVPSSATPRWPGDPRNADCNFRVRAATYGGMKSFAATPHPRATAPIVSLALALLATLATACAPSTTVRPSTVASTNAAPPITRTLLEQRDLEESPGWETRLYLIHYEPGAAAPLHHHPVEGMGYVVRGSFESAFEGEAPVVVHDGQSFRDRAKVPHTLFRNADPSKPLDFVIAYVVRKGAPVMEAP